MGSTAEERARSLTGVHAEIPEDQVIMICVAMGYPDDSFPANAVVSKRRPVEEVATFVGFEEE